MDADLIFDPGAHTYTVNGTALPSVTEVVAPLGVDYDDMGDVELMIDAAAERGTVCHAIIEQMLEGDDNIEYPAMYEGYIDAVRLFLSEHFIVPLAIEEPVYSAEIGVAGTPDLLCEFDGDLAIVDYKFVSQVAKAKVKAQLNGYLRIYCEHGVFPERLIAVQFLQDGAYRLYPVSIDDTEFMLCLGLYRAKTKKHPRGRIE